LARKQQTPATVTEMSFFELEKELDRGKILPLYLLHGVEGRLMHEAQKRIESTCLKPQTRDFNFDLFIGGETSPDRIIDAAKTLPMMAPWRVVVVKRVDVFTPEQVKALLVYCEAPVSSTCLILLGENLGPWKRYLRVLEKHGKVVSFPHPKGNQITRYILHEAKGMGKQISPEAAGVIGELVGNHFDEVYQELAKVASYVGERAEIRIDDVEAVISPVRDYTIFELTRAMGMKNCPDALKTLNQMVDRGEPHLKILTMIVRQFRLIWMAKEMESRGMGKREIGKKIKIPEFYLQGFLAQLRNFTFGELATGYRRLLETDVALKSRSTSKKILLENLILSLCR
jgi:DNA polymerase-3 subunit delta